MDFSNGSVESRFCGVLHPSDWMRQASLTLSRIMDPPTGITLIIEQVLTDIAITSGN
jgi:hypothetical protein